MGQTQKGWGVLLSPVTPTPIYISRHPFFGVNHCSRSILCPAHLHPPHIHLYSSKLATQDVRRCLLGRHHVAYRVPCRQHFHRLYRWQKYGLPCLPLYEVRCLICIRYSTPCQAGFIIVQLRHCLAFGPVSKQHPPA